LPPTDGVPGEVAHASGRSAAWGPPHALELAAKALARPALSTDRLDPRGDLADDRRWAVVDVAGGRDRRADARFDRPDDLDDSLTFGDQGMDHVAGTDLRRWLCRVAVDADVPAVAELGRHGAGLDEPHRAQPAIDPCVVGHGSGVVRSILAELEQVAVRVAQEAASLASVDDRRGQELPSPRAEELVGRLAVVDADREEVVSQVRIGRRGEGHGRLVVRRSPTLDQQQPGAREAQDDGRAVLAVQGGAEHVRVPGAAACGIAHDQDVREGGVGRGEHKSRLARARDTPRSNGRPGESTTIEGVRPRPR